MELTLFKKYLLVISLLVHVVTVYYFQNLLSFNASSPFITDNNFIATNWPVHVLPAGKSLPNRHTRYFLLVIVHTYISILLLCFVLNLRLAICRPR